MAIKKGKEATKREMSPTRPSAGRPILRGGGDVAGKAVNKPQRDECRSSDKDSVSIPKPKPGKRGKDGLSDENAD